MRSLKESCELGDPGDAPHTLQPGILFGLPEVPYEDDGGMASTSARASSSGAPPFQQSARGWHQRDVPPLCVHRGAPRRDDPRAAPARTS